MIVAIVFAAAPFTHVLAVDPRKAHDAYFESYVRPFLANRCLSCHGTEKQDGNLRLDSREALERGNGKESAIRAGKPKESPLIQYLEAREGNEIAEHREVSAAQVAHLRQWIQDGAVYPTYDLEDPGKPYGFTESHRDFWAFRPIGDVTPPDVKNPAWVRSPVDAFILQSLESEGLQPSEPADRLTLLRRVTYDLTGLPPTREEIEAFLADVSPEAFEAVVDRLLRSPRYGERWGRHWLDVARFAESAAHDGNNGYLFAWRYRDYVIKSFNDDKPYNEFVVEQLAGDLFPVTGDAEVDLSRQVATGFLQIGPKPVVMRDKQQMLLEIADEQIHATGVAFMGLTLGCARCHDHKFDPVPTSDYYALAGIFLSTKIMHDFAADSKWIEPEFEMPDGQKIKVMAVRDHDEPRNARVHVRGSYKMLGEEVPRRVLQIVAGDSPPTIDGSSSGRLELARWLARDDHPLTPRVMVNRIWQKHFTQGLSRSVEDFGARGDEPSHPELLDFLARRFVESGWSIKAMHRLMLLSSTYQQSYTENERFAIIDPDNRLLWRMPRRLLSAEEIRDSLLAVSGELDFTMGGTLFTSGFTYNRPDVELSVVNIGSPDSYGPYAEPRRSVYLPVVRNQMHPVLALFDVANEHEPVARRTRTIVPPQALFMMNNGFVRTQAKILARLANANASREDAVRDVFARILGRFPDADEVAHAHRYLEEYLEAVDPDGSRRTRVEGSGEVVEDPADYSKLVLETPGLVAYYQFDEHVSDSSSEAVAIRDSAAPASASGQIHGSSGSKVVLGQPGVPRLKAAGHSDAQAITLNGKDDAVILEASADFELDRQISVEYWIKPAAVSQHQTAVGRDGHGTDKPRLWKSGLMRKEVEGKTRLVVYHEIFSPSLGGFRTVADPGWVAEVGKWTHVVMTYDGGERALHVNGIEVDRFSVQGKIPTGETPISLGATLDVKEPLQGQLDDVSIYNRGLTSHEVVSRYVAGTGRLPERVDDDPYVEAWSSYCHALFCLNEFIFVD